MFNNASVYGGGRGSQRAGQQQGACGSLHEFGINSPQKSVVEEYIVVTGGRRSLIHL